MGVGKVTSLFLIIVLYYEVDSNVQDLRVSGAT